MAGVPLNPSKFAEDGGLLDASMEEVVSMLLDKEKHRHKDAKENESEQEVVVSAKVTPMGLLAVLDLASHNLGVSRSMLTKCLSHQIACWYDSLPNLGVLTEEFYGAYSGAVGTGNPDLCDGLRNTSYRYNSSLTGRATTFRTISWVLNKLGNLSLPLGLSPTVLFHIGLCWSVARSSDDVYRKTIDKFLRAEPDKLIDYIGGRSVRVKGFIDEVNYRLKS